MRQLKINKSITNRSEESLDKYLTEISRVPMVTTEEEVLLAQAIHAGGKKGEKAKERLVTANLRFVVSVAKQYQNQGVPLTDLMADMLASSLEYASDRKMDFDSLCTDLNQVLSCILNERERTIVVQSFGIGCPECSLDDIGYSMGLTRERVRQIRERGLEKIRKHPQSRLLLKHVA